MEGRKGRGEEGVRMGKGGTDGGREVDPPLPTILVAHSEMLKLTSLSSARCLYAVLGAWSVLASYSTHTQHRTHKKTQQGAHASVLVLLSAANGI